MRAKTWLLLIAGLVLSFACHKEDINPADDQQDGDGIGFVTKEIGLIESLDITGHGTVYLKKGDKWTISYNTKSSTVYSYSDVSNHLYIDQSEDSILITGPDLSQIGMIKIVDAGLTELDPMTCPNPKYEISGSATLSLMFDSVVYADIIASDSAKIAVHGENNEAIEVEMSGYSIFDGSATLLNTGAEVYLSDNSQATVYTNAIVQGEISGNSVLYVKGDPVIDVKTSGNAQVIKVSK
jgi:hypothetical protein